MSSVNDVIGLNKLYVDRIWLLAKPAWWKPRTDEFREKYHEYRTENAETGKSIFQQITDNFYKVYRTIDTLKIAFRKGVEVKSVDDLIKLRRYGKREEEDFEDFQLLPDGKVEIGKIKMGKIGEVPRLVLTKEQILSLEESTRPIVERGYYEIDKLYYMRLEPWFSIQVRPFVIGVRPPIIRCFLNGIIFVKTAAGLKFDTSNYEFHTENWVDPYNNGFNFEEFIKMQGFFLKFLKEKMPEVIRGLWIGFFNWDEELDIKVTQVELCHDSYIDKLRLVNALRLIPGKSKTMKHDVSEDKYTTEGNDIGMKYYVTIQRGLQIKTYSKAYNKLMARVLNRLEVTQNLRKSLSELGEKDLFNDKVKELVIRVNAGLSDDKTIEEIRKMISVFVRAKKPEYRCLHETFLLDLFIHGQVKGKGVYRELARIYAKHGIIEVQGRGRNSVYALTPEYVFVHEKIRKVFGDIPTKLFPTKEHPSHPIDRDSLTS